ncbi:MAG: TrmH family RNA methyltransferase [Nocardioidaceae bacterium]
MNRRSPSLRRPDLGDAECRHTDQRAMTAAAELLTLRSPRVKKARRLTRRACRLSERRFLAEGPQAVREALGRPQCVVEVFATRDATERLGELRDTAAKSDIAWHLVEVPAAAALTATATPQGVVAVCNFIDQPLELALAAAPTLVVVCADVRDPGNAGAVIRCADAAGAGAAIMAGDSVDPYNGKAVRASVGSVFHLPIVFGLTMSEVTAALRAHGVTLLAADNGGDMTLDEALADGILSAPTAWLFGNEAWGLPPEHASLADHVVRVPIYGRAESLNLAAAAAVCLYTSAGAQRQTRPQSW